MEITLNHGTRVWVRKLCKIHIELKYLFSWIATNRMIIGWTIVITVLYWTVLSLTCTRSEHKHTHTPPRRFWLNCAQRMWPWQKSFDGWCGCCFRYQFRLIQSNVCLLSCRVDYMLHSNNAFVVRLANFDRILWFNFKLLLIMKTTTFLLCVIIVQMIG